MNDVIDTLHKTINWRKTNFWAQIVWYVSAQELKCLFPPFLVCCQNNICFCHRIHNIRHHPFVVSKARIALLRVCASWGPPLNGLDPFSYTLKLTNGSDQNFMDPFLFYAWDTECLNPLKPNSFQRGAPWPRHFAPPLGPILRPILSSFRYFTDCMSTCLCFFISHGDSTKTVLIKMYECSGGSRISLAQGTARGSRGLASL